MSHVPDDDEARRFRRALRRSDGEGDGDLLAFVACVVFGFAGMMLALDRGLLWRTAGAITLIASGLISVWMEVDGLAGLGDLARDTTRPLDKRAVRDLYDRFSAIMDLSGRLKLAGLLLLIGVFTASTVVWEVLQ